MDVSFPLQCTYPLQDTYVCSMASFQQVMISNVSIYSKIARNAVKQGKLVSDEIVTDLILREIEENNHKNDDKNGYLLDGYPRTLG